MNAMTQPVMTLSQYLAWEESQDERHEFHAGDVFAMVGGRRTHGRVVSNLSAAWVQALKGTPCQVFSEGMKVQVGDQTVLYPDLFVTCDRQDLATDIVFRAPTLVVEVVSPSSQGDDRGPKFGLYRRLQSLVEYILIDPDLRSVEAFRRGSDGRWTFDDLSSGDSLHAASIDARVTFTDLFDGVDPPA